MDASVSSSCADLMQSDQLDVSRTVYIRTTLVEPMDSVDQIVAKDIFEVEMVEGGRDEKRLDRV